MPEKREMLIHSQVIFMYTFQIPTKQKGFIYVHTKT